MHNNNAKRWSFLGNVFFRSKGYVEEDQEGISIDSLGRYFTFLDFNIAKHRYCNKLLLTIK